MGLLKSMMQGAVTRSVGLVVLILLVWVGGSTRAQHHSSAFDPNCYQPDLTNPAQADSICGDTADQMLGRDLVNIGPPPGSQYGSCVYALGTLKGDYTYGPDTINDVSLDSPPPIDLHQPKYGKRLSFQLPGPISHIGPIHTRTSRDLVITDVANSNAMRIYWEQPDGSYKPDVYTDLILNDSQHWSGMVQIIDRIVSDTVEDVLTSTLAKGPAFAMFYNGGSALYNKGRFALPDSTTMLDTGYSGHNRNRIGIQGRFAGTPACVSMNIDGNLFYSAAERPFSLSEFARAYREDTLLEAADNRRLFNPGFTGMSLVSGFKAFPKAPGDSTDDLLFSVTLDSNLTSNDYILFYKGGPDFGKHRIFVDSADFKIRNPSARDSYFESASRFTVAGNFGDLTRTGNNVLCAQASTLTSTMVYFYVLGQAMDDKVDMYFETFPRGLGLDTITANLDGYEDIICANPEWQTLDDAHKGVFNRGTVMIVYGSSKIPSTNGSVVERNVGSQQRGIGFWPNPVQEHGALALTGGWSGSVRVEVINVLGACVWARELTASEAERNVQIVLSGQANGVYIIRAIDSVTSAEIRIVKGP